MIDKKAAFAVVAASMLLARASMAEFDPKSGISACVLWLDGKDVDGDGKPDAIADDAPVARWADKSGGGHHASQSAPSLEPDYAKVGSEGRPTIRFDGDDFLASDLVHAWSGDWTVFAVASMDSDAKDNWRGIIGNRFGKGGAQWWTLGIMSNGTTYLELAGGRGVKTQFVPRSVGAQAYSVVRRARNCTLYRNGAMVGAFGMASVGGESNELRVGRWFASGQGWDGEISEIIVYCRALGDDERKRVEAYLADKWGIRIPPDLYAKRGTWAETMLASRKASLDYQAKSDFKPYVGEIVHDGMPALWQRIAADYPAETAGMVRDMPGGKHLAWFESDDGVEIEKSMIRLAGEQCGRELATLIAAKASPNDPRWLDLCAKASVVRERFSRTRARLAVVDFKTLRRAVEDLSKAFPEQYGKGGDRLASLDACRKRRQGILDALGRCENAAITEANRILAMRRDALLANPLLDFDKLLLVKRRMVPNKSGHGGHVGDPYGLPQNWQSNSSIRSDVWDNEIAVMSKIRSGGELATLYRPKGTYFVGDMDLDFDADKLLFSSVGTHKRWHVFEIKADGAGLRQLTPAEHKDVNNYDACYLPDGRILFTSTASMVSVPCVNGSSLVANLYRMDADGKNIRQLCFDQEHNWCPTVLANGRILYARWEYTDTPHAHARLMFHMNPDGTAQMEYYGSNSYWPNALFYARPIPDRPTQFVAVVSGHHGVRRMGELVLFDTAKGRREADGVVQRIPGYGKKVEPLIEDNLVDGSWPKFLHPYPLSEKYFITACQPTPASRWGIYLVDVFDNMLLLKEEPDYALLEPIPFRKTPRPPVMPDKVDLKRNDAVVYLTDVYMGDGLKGIPRGTVKKLRLFTYTFLYPHMGGPQGVVGMEGPWDIKRVLGTVPVRADGSALFRVPANMPIAVQPLDSEGKALQLMRSWFTGMPGEVLSCVGCHEQQNTTPPSKQTLAASRAPDEIEPWYGPMRGFSFAREVQPVLDRYCVSCHNGKARPDGKEIVHLCGTKKIKDYTSKFHFGGRDAGLFTIAYAELHRFVRRPGLESDYHLLTPMEYHADTTQLIQMLRKGHHNVKLDPESWDRLVTWVDLNAPYHGTWTEIAGPKRVDTIAKRRRELRKLYVGTDDDPEFIYEAPKRSTKPVMPAPMSKAKVARVDCPGWPFDAARAKRRQAKASAGKPQRSIDLGGGVKLDLVLVPAGEFVMGDASGHPDEGPASRVKIDRSYWMGRVEITNEQFARFDPLHDSKVESKHAMQFGVRGFYVNGPRQPVVRVSWTRATAFCEWLTAETGRKFSLPTEAQWEYACRAGTATPFSYGGTDTDFAKFANLADRTLTEFVCHPYKKHRDPYKEPYKYDDWIPKDSRFRDNGFVSEEVGRYQPNAWGLCDMHGNVAEWTRSALKPYPYRDDDGRNIAGFGRNDAGFGRNDAGYSGDRVVRGGSWRDRPVRSRSAFRLSYRPYQCVYNVGFRVVCESERIVRSD